MTLNAVPAQNRVACKLCNEDVEVGDLYVPKLGAHESCVRNFLPKVDDAARARAAQRKDTMPARFNGRCKYCGGETTAGSPIVRGDWTHAECKEALIPELARHDAEAVAQQLSGTLPYGELKVAGKRLFFSDGYAAVVLSDEDVDRLLSAKRPGRVLESLVFVRGMATLGSLPVLR